jgi:hypothetical protein
MRHSESQFRSSNRGWALNHSAFSEREHEAFVSSRAIPWEQCTERWNSPSRSATSQYNPQLFSRTHYLDWWKILEAVKKEAQSVQDEEKEPKELISTDPSTKGLSR